MDTLALAGYAVPIAVAIALLFVVAIAAGTLGSLLGLGGGLVLVPALVLLFNIEIHLAVAASLVSVIATSTGAASVQVESGFTNPRLGMFLETATAVGGLAGAILAVTILATHGQIVIAAFVPVVLGAAFYMYAQRGRDVDPDPPHDRLADRLQLGGRYPDPDGGGTRSYRITGTALGLTISGLAGVASGLLGIGGGLFKVPAMNSIMNTPMRVAGATSTFMIGVTAAAGALVYLFAGDVGLLITAPTAVGTILGSQIGSELRPRATTPFLKDVFVVVLLVAAASMLGEVLGVFP
ncbi:MAG: sulfite exporter TauE/SafE family protein [Thermoplasmata archaeon]|nr:sulfite exporter TauE/SafE family protein [Thermoplasmata archaeon]